MPEPLNFPPDSSRTNELLKTIYTELNKNGEQVKSKPSQGLQSLIREIEQKMKQGVQLDSLTQSLLNQIKDKVEGLPETKEK